MGKEATPPKYAGNQAGAVAKFIRVPPRKARLVMDEVRGKYVSDALALLKFVPNFAARAIEDVIQSAVANATTPDSRPVDGTTGKRQPALDEDSLKIVRAFIDEGPRIKRLQPRAQGRAFRILKRMCHISVVVEEIERPKVQRKAKPARRAKAAGRPAQARPATAATRKAPPPAAVEPETTTAAAEQAEPGVDVTEATETAAPAAVEPETSSEATAVQDASAAPKEEGSTASGEAPEASTDSADDTPADDTSKAKEE